ncbi:hypothetical protein AVO44_18335 [Ruegeria profundi]|uniref:Uncharacterized protein n=1 Tax=Ruegeria profundi TaxID=1685378 RepID=A0A0X3TN16_9RHOB|nr:hypothetical protein [Ruegeria profundi]KUJ77167.1 hypothetical protein AVO44_18335 [Ruegeria profundi]
MQNADGYSTDRLKQDAGAQFLAPLRDEQQYLSIPIQTVLPSRLGSSALKLTTQLSDPNKAHHHKSR